MFAWLFVIYAFLYYSSDYDDELLRARPGELLTDNNKKK